GPPHTPGRLDGWGPWLTEIAPGLIDNLAGQTRADIVDDVAYPLPVTTICKILGVPPEDQPRFRAWADAIIDAVDPTTGTLHERTRRRNRVNAELGQYLNGLADAHARHPGDDLISGLLTATSPHGPMSRGDLLATATLLLLAGHQTPVTLITNGMLPLLRHPGLPARLTREPALIVTLTEELLRYDPPVHLLPNRATLADIPIADTTIPAASPLALVLAARNRDPRRFPHPHPAPGLTPGLRHLPRPPAGPPQSPGRPPRPTPPARHPPAGHRPATLPAQPGTARPPPPPRRLRHRRPGRTSGPRSLAQSFN